MIRLVVKEVTREDAKNDSRVQWMMENDVLSGKELGGTKSSLTKYVAQTWRRVTSGADDWNPLMLSHALVQEADGSFWNTTLPCQTIARQYPRSYAIDHFSFHGASWQDGCTPKERQAMVVEWLEKNIRDGEPRASVGVVVRSHVIARTVEFTRHARAFARIRRYVQEGTFAHRIFASARRRVASGRGARDVVQPPAPFGALGARRVGSVGFILCKLYKSR